MLKQRAREAQECEWCETTDQSDGQNQLWNALNAGTVTSLTLQVAKSHSVQSDRVTSGSVGSQKSAMKERWHH